MDRSQGLNQNGLARQVESTDRSLPTLSATRAVPGTNRPREEARVPRLGLLGEALAEPGRSTCAAADHRPGPRRARGESDGAYVYRRLFRAVAVPRAPQGRVCQPAELAAPR